MSTGEVVLSYIGAILIAMEFVRKFTRLQALMGMLAGWPVSSFLREKRFEDWYETYKNHKLNITLRLIFSLMLLFLTIPLTIIFYVIWFMVLILNSFHNWVNRLYFKGTKRYRPLYMYFIGLTLSALKMSEYKKFADVNEQKVMREIEKGEIPILPIIGVILISIAFVLFLI
ncbi:hypothetical protein ACFLW4_04775 [Chloroflexota bacterium]